jgi:integrase
MPSPHYIDGAIHRLKLEIEKLRHEHVEAMKAATYMDTTPQEARIACALRPSELLALRWRDPDVEAKTFTIRETIYPGESGKKELRPFTKTTSEGETDKALLTVPVPDSLLKELIEYRGEDKKREGKRFRVISSEPEIKVDFYVNDDDFIFHNLENGNFLVSENILFRVFDPIEEELGLKLNFQVLRRTAATLGQRKGSVKDI